MLSDLLPKERKKCHHAKNVWKRTLRGKCLHPFCWYTVLRCFDHNILRVRFMVFNTTFNNISVISWWSVLLVKEKTIDLLQVTVKLYYIMLYRVHLAWAGFKLTTLGVIGTDCIDIHKFNYNPITMAPSNVNYIETSKNIDFCLAYITTKVT